jgi:hypothetical protein
MYSVSLSVTQNIFVLLAVSAKCEPHLSLSIHLFILHNYWKDFNYTCHYGQYEKNKELSFGSYQLQTITQLMKFKGKFILFSKQIMIKKIVIQY